MHGLNNTVAALKFPTKCVMVGGWGGDGGHSADGDRGKEINRAGSSDKQLIKLLKKILGNRFD